jgi:hypothetical protein
MPSRSKEAIAMDTFDDGQRLRNQSKATTLAATRPPPVTMSGAPAMTAKILAGSTGLPTTPAVFFAVQGGIVTGDEAEGGTGTLIGGLATFYALNLGTAIPALGSFVLITYVNSRWVFRYDG